MRVDIGQIRPLIGMGADKLLPAVASVSDDSTLGQSMGRRKKAIFETFLPSLQPTPGARPLLEYLLEQGIQPVIATSADDREMEALLQRAGVDDLLPQRASKDDASESKPDPDIVHAALNRSSARPESAVMIGDTPYDIEAARRRALARLRCGAEVTGPTGTCAMPWQSLTIPQHCSHGGVETRDDWPLLKSIRVLRFDRRLDSRDFAPGCRAS